MAKKQSKIVKWFKKNKNQLSKRIYSFLWRFSPTEVLIVTAFLNGDINFNQFVQSSITAFGLYALNEVTRFLNKKKS